ncbi:MAG: DUF2163 domain-containing protein [Alphaproteobacteria bacterium]|nr:DUF2163 domain-containing protein [Alphaproteobacteria bacterium]
MKTLPPGLEAHLRSGATTLCWCWRLTRRDGARLGFTDHDRNLEFDGTVFEAEAGFEAGEMAESIGLSVDNLEVAGGITSERLAERDLAAGLYDDAKVEIFRVNWQSPAERVLMRQGSLGEVRRSGKAFSAEIRGMSHYLQQPKGRLYQFTCDTDLGSPKCGVDVSKPAHRATAVVAERRSDTTFRAALSASFVESWFARGLASFTSGAAAGFESEVRAHTQDGDGDWLTLWQAPPVAIAEGDGLVVTVGCDKHFTTCRDRFQNVVNFRGFPHMPGNDFVTGYVRRNRS